MNRAAESACLDAVAAWKLEERGQENVRYFFETKAASGLYSGEQCFVIGRKGSGKTAIAEHILNLDRYDTFARTLSFRHFPFNILAKFEQEGFAGASRFTNIWKYITYVTLLQALAGNEAVSPDFRARIDEEMPRDLGRATSDYIGQITDRSFGVKILGSGGDLAGKTNYRPNDTPIYERVTILEKLIAEHIDDSTYFILYDDLDDDYDRESAHAESTYARLLGGLFRATIDIKATFGGRAKVYPVVFLRDDIFDMLMDNNKAKWSDSSVDLRWQSRLLGDMVTYRIFRAAGLDARAAMLQNGGKATDEALGLIFESSRFRPGRRRRTRPLIAEIERRSYGRPRDVVAYLRIAARHAIQNDEAQISAQTLKSIERAYSQYLIDDLIDELHTKLPDIQKVLSIVSSNGTASLHYNEVSARLAAAMKEFSGHTQALGAGGIIDVLVNASILGKQLPVENRQEFRYQNRFIRVEPKDKLYIHRGLHGGLMVA